MNVGQLKEAIKDVADSVPVVVESQDSWQAPVVYPDADCVLTKAVQMKRNGVLSELIGPENSYKSEEVVPIVLIK